MFLSERIAADNITITSHLVGQTSERYRWSVTLHRPDGRAFTLPDPYESSDEPTAFDVLNLLASACSIIDQADGWHGWQSAYMSATPCTPEWGERDSIYTEHMYDTWCGINEGLCAFLGHQGHEDYLYDTDRSA